MDNSIPEIKRILDKYNYELPRISNQKYNDFLKVLGSLAGLRKSLSSHVSRHTFATYLINKGAPIETVAKTLGHSTTKQPQHYAKLAASKVLADFDKIFNKKITYQYY